MHDPLPAASKAVLQRDTARARFLAPAQDITTPTVLICGHGSRDSRCGTLGPILQDAFEQELRRRNMDGNVAQISHVGGHKFAGNVIMYVPPALGGEEGNPLSGAGIWYGRVGPEHVEGLVEETLVKGRVVLELLRGGVTQGGGEVGRMVEAQVKRERGEDDDGGVLRLKPSRRR